MSAGPDGASDDANEFMERAVERVVAMKLQVPVLLFLECMKPFTFLAEQSLILIGPLLWPLLAPGRLDALCAFLAEPSNVEKLIARIEEISEKHG